MAPEPTVYRSLAEAQALLNRLHEREWNALQGIRDGLAALGIDTSSMMASEAKHLFIYVYRTMVNYGLDLNNSECWLEGIRQAAEDAESALKKLERDKGQ
jgi:hypothetical protein